MRLLFMEKSAIEKVQKATEIKQQMDHFSTSLSEIKGSVNDVQRAQRKEACSKGSVSKLGSLLQLARFWFHSVHFFSM